MANSSHKKNDGGGGVAPKKKTGGAESHPTKKTGGRSRGKIKDGRGGVAPKEKTGDAGIPSETHGAGGLWSWRPMDLEAYGA